MNESTLQIFGLLQQVFAGVDRLEFDLWPYQREALESIEDGTEE